MRPPLPIEWESSSLSKLNAAFQQDAIAMNTSLALSTSYFDGLQQHSSSAIPLSPSCIRRDMGVLRNLS